LISFVLDRAQDVGIGACSCRDRPSQARWLTTPARVFENRSPLELLKSGQIDRVVREARGVGAIAG
jgi:hypothetical protein